MSWLANSPLRFVKLLTEQEVDGQGLVEYAMILMLVALACVASLLALSDGIKTEFWDLITNVLIPVLGA